MVDLSPSYKESPWTSKMQKQMKKIEKDEPGPIDNEAQSDLMMQHYKDARVPRPEFFLDEDNEFIEKTGGEFMQQVNPG